ncbi:MAG: DUF4037 domain-containing protein [Erysipelotrichaceae bacterium]|nr:DUF4037 domain-containing protein [Erysipelotrichaceae bacterium]
MRGIELSRGYYEEFGKPMLEQDFPDLLPYIAVGFVGSGSERYGYDDEVSQDHDYEPGFCIFLPSEEVVDRKRAFQLERAYAKLPKEYKGIKRQLISAVGGDRNGVIRTAEFFGKAVGAKDGNLTIQQWLEIPDYALAEAVNGEVFYDGYGEFSAIRERLLEYPEDIMLKRLAGNLLIMAQSGQYNFMRCLKHGEVEAAQLACHEFVNAAIKVTFLLQGRYVPYYKWSFRALRSLLFTEELVKRLSFILMADHSDAVVAEDKYTAMEEIASWVIEDLQGRELTEAICGDLEKHAYSVNDHIKDNEIRNLNILATIR